MRATYPVQPAPLVHPVGRLDPGERRSQRKHFAGHFEIGIVEKRIHSTEQIVAEFSSSALNGKARNAQRPGEIAIHCITGQNAKRPRLSSRMRSPGTLL